MPTSPVQPVDPTTVEWPPPIPRTSVNVKIAEGVRGPSWVFGSVSGGLGCSVEVEVAWNPHVLRYVCLSWRTTAQQAETVTSAIVRDLIQQRPTGVEANVRAVLQHAVETFGRRPARPLRGVDAHPPWGLDYPTEVVDWDEIYRWAAHFYVIGYAVEATPTAYVAQKMRVSKPTASRYVREARARGYIPKHYKARSGRAHKD